MKRSKMEIAALCLVVGSLGLAGICAVGATCSAPAPTVATDCHEEGEATDQVCCRSIGLSAERPASTPTSVSTARALIAEGDVTRSTLGIELRASLAGHRTRPQVEVDPQDFFCVYLT